MNICPSCNRRTFSNGGHENGCKQDPTKGLPREHPGFLDRDPLDEQRFVSVWDEITFYNDGDEGDRQ